MAPRAHELPEQLLSKFRTVTLERLDRIETCWNELRGGAGGPQREVDLAREVNTVKSDSRVMGATGVNFVCQKLEDLLYFARQRRYQVPDEFDMVVTMSLQFMAMLIRKKAGASLAGVDLTGFVRQLEEVLRAAQATAAAEGGGAGLSAADFERADRISAATRERLARIATSVYLEALAAWGASSVRLQEAWRGLVREAAILEAIPLGSLLMPLREAALERARALGRQVEILLDVGAHRAAADVAEALRVAVAQALHNAVEHGIEPSGQRAAAGKREAGTVRVRAREEGDRLELVVEDDGRGVELGEIRRRGVERGLLSAQAAERAEDEELLELLFQPRLSSREGEPAAARGRGLDAARAAVSRVGGTAELWTRAGAGTSVILRAPQVSRVAEVLRLSVPGSSLVFAVDGSWSVFGGGSSGPVTRIDPLAALGLPRAEEPGRREVVQLRRGGVEVELLCRARPMVGMADRICATDEQYPVEVVRIAGSEALLIRPERLLQATLAARELMQQG